MESSTVVAFRALVMVACLVLVPLAAIFGSAFPDVVKSLVNRCIASSKPAAAPSVSRGSAPLFGPAVPSSTTASLGSSPPRELAGPGPNERSGMVPASPDRAVYPSPAASDENAMAPGSGNLPARFEGPANSPSSEPAVGDRTGLDNRDYPPRAEIGPPRDLREPSHRAGGPNAPADRDPTASSMPSGSMQPERFSALERRLRQYGATYYLLEKRGNDGELYRFYCQMAVGNNPNRTKRFEVTDSDALRAMARVVEQVEAWRTGRAP